MRICGECGERCECVCEGVGDEREVCGDEIVWERDEREGEGRRGRGRMREGWCERRCGSVEDVGRVDVRIEWIIDCEFGDVGGGDEFVECDAE